MQKTLIKRFFSSNIRFLDVTVGEYDRGANDVGARTIQVKNKIIHPEFVPSTLRNDICLLELQEEITFSSVAQPVCFPEKNSRIDHVKLGEGPLCYVAGWGRIGETLGTARILQETQVIYRFTASSAIKVATSLTIKLRGWERKRRVNATL